MQNLNTLEFKKHVTYGEMLFVAKRYVDDMMQNEKDSYRYVGEDGIRTLYTLELFAGIKASESADMLNDVMAAYIDGSLRKLYETRCNIKEVEMFTKMCTDGLRSAKEAGPANRLLDSLAELVHKIAENGGLDLDETGVPSLEELIPENKEDK